MSKLYPLQFEPIFKDAIWGGHRIAEQYRKDAPARCGESWEISDRTEGMSIISNGPLKGKSLHQLVEEFGEKLLGLGRKESRFPLLIKLIDARQDLSIQVHPSEETAALCHGEPKTEMWYVLEEGPIYAGFKNPTNRETFSQAIQSNRVVDLIQHFQVESGDVVFIPGGRVHAIGAGCMMLEVQQNSDTTYRVYDWNRIGADGKKRQLHINEALQCIKWDDDNNPIIPSELLEESGNVQRRRLISTLFFSMEKISISDSFHVNADPTSFQIFFYLTGKQKGTFVLLPAVSNSMDLKGPADLLRITI